MCLYFPKCICLFICSEDDVFIDWQLAAHQIGRQKHFREIVIDLLYTKPNLSKGPRIHFLHSMQRPKPPPHQKR